MLCLTAFVLIIAASSSGGPVLDRIDPDNRIPSIRCRIGYAAHTQVVMMGELKEQFWEGNRMMRRLNCTLIALTSLVIGKPDANGSYNGAIGRIQRHEVDSGLLPIRLDYFSSLPTNVMSLGFAADVVIAMRKEPSNTMHLSLNEICLNNFDAITVSFILISFFFVSATLAFTTEPTYNPVTVFVNMIDNMRKAIFAIIDQENFDAENAASNANILMFNLFLLFGIHGIMMGLVGTDLITDVDHPIVESLDEFSNTSEVQPTVIKSWFLWPVLEKAEPGSELWPLKVAVLANETANLPSYDTQSDYTAFGSLLNVILTGKRALIIPSIVHLLDEVLCSVNPGARKNVTTSKKSFAQSEFAALISYKADPLLRQFIEFLIRSISETGQIVGVVKYTYRTKIQPAADNDPERILATNKCNEGFKHENRPPRNFDLALYAPIFEQHFIAAAVAFVLLLCEVFVHRLRTPVRNMIRKGGHLIGKSIRKRSKGVKKRVTHVVALAAVRISNRNK
jgi:hypothetical protein